MPIITVIKDMDQSNNNPLRGVAKENLVHLPDPHIIIGTLEAGMKSGATSIMITMSLPDGKILAAETSLSAFKAAAVILNTIPE